MQFVVLSSSRGTTFRAVLEAIKNDTLHAACLGLVTDHNDRGCVNVAKEFDVPVVIVEKNKGEDREIYDQRLHEAILSLGTPDHLCALGWMWILSSWFVTQWNGKIINVHPSLLPKHPGAHAISDTLAAKDAVAGMTIHVIDEGVDTGPVLLQKSCPVDPSDTEETLKEKIQALEREWYPKVLEEMVRKV